MCFKLPVLDCAACRELKHAMHICSVCGGIAHERTCIPTARVAAVQHNSAVRPSARGATRYLISACRLPFDLSVAQSVAERRTCVQQSNNRIGLQGGIYTATYEPYGHVQHLLRTEANDRKEKEDIAMQLIQEEEAAKRAAEKKKKKKKKTQV